MFQKKIVYMMLGGLLALGIVFGGAAAFAQTDDGSTDGSATPAASTPSVVEDGLTDSFPERPNFRGHGNGIGNRGDRGEALAEALGITVEELQTAMETARQTMLDEAVANGLLTQEQADAIQSRGGMHRGFPGGNFEQALADALGITVEDLQAAMDTVFTNQLAEMVDAGVITQEQADQMAARRAVKEYVDEEAIQNAIQSIYEDAVSQALADGVITQEQADALLNDIANGPAGFGTPRFGGPHGGHGGPGGPRGGHGGPRGGQGGQGFPSFPGQPDA